MHGDNEASHQDCLHWTMLFNARQAHVETLDFVSKPSMIDAEAVEDGCVQVVNVDGVFDDVVAEFVGFAVDDAGLDAAASHPDREAARVVVAAVVFAGQPALAVDRPAKFAAPDHERFIEQAALMQVVD